MTNTEYTELIWNEVVKRVAELPDRSSPDDWPEAMLVTGDELHMIVSEALSTLLASEERLTKELAEAKKRLEELGDF